MSLRGHWLRFCESVWIWAAAIPVTAIIAIALSLWLVGCADYGYQWKKRHAPLTQIAIVTVADTDAMCRKYINAAGYGRFLGCAVRNYSVGVCTIFLPTEYPDWLLKHERRHCETGEDHP